MQVDADIQVSKWQRCVELLFCLAVIILLWHSNFSMLIKLLSIGAFVVAQFVFKQAINQRKIVQQLWQIDHLTWAWRYNNESRVYKAHLITIDYRHVVLRLSFRVAQNQQQIVIWRDQVSRTQWRYFKIIANLKYQDT